MRPSTLSCKYSLLSAITCPAPVLRAVRNPLCSHWGQSTSSRYSTSNVPLSKAEKRQDQAVLSTNRLRTLLNAGNYQGVLHEFNQAHERNHATAESYQLVLEACARVGDLATASRLIDFARKQGPGLSSEAYAKLLKAAAKGSNPVERVVRTLADLEKKVAGQSRLGPDAYLFVARVLLLEGQEVYTKAALSLVDQMDASTTNRTLDSLGLRLLASATLNKPEELLATASFLDAAPSLELLAFRTIAFTRCRGLDNRCRRTYVSVLAMLDTIESQANSQTMKDTQLESEDLYHLAIGSAYKCFAEYRHLHNALELRRRGREIAFKSLSTEPHRDGWLKVHESGALQVIYAILGDTDSTSAIECRELHRLWLSIVDDMRYRRILQDKETCNLVLELQTLAVRDGLCSMEETTTLFEDMRKDGFVPSVKTYNLLMGGWASAIGINASQRSKRVTGLLEALRRAGHRPDQTSYAHVFKACAPAGEQQMTSVPRNAGGEDIMEDASAIMYDHERQMLSEGLAHDYNSASAMIGALLELGHFEQAIQRLTDMRLSGINRDVTLYNDIFWKCGADLTGHAAAYALRDLRYTMRRDHVTPNIRTYYALFKCCSSAGDVATALELLQEMDGKAIAPTLKIYRIVLKMLDATGELLVEERNRILKHIEG